MQGEAKTAGGGKRRTTNRGESGFFELMSKAPSTLSSLPQRTASSAEDRCAEDDAFEAVVARDQWRKSYMTMGDNHGWQIIFQIQGTILPTLFRHPIFIICISVFATLRTLVLLHFIDTDVDGAEFRGVTLLGSAVTFFLVFYASQSYQRFSTQYLCAMQACNDIQSFAIFSRASMPRPLALRLVRQINAAQMLAYICISESCNDVFLRGCNRAYHILTTTEEEYLSEMPLTDARPMSVLIQWIIIDVNKGMVNEQITPIRGETLTLTADAVKKSLQKLFYYKDQQVPYIYVHLAALLSYVYLPLLAVVLAITPSEHSSQILWEIQNAAALVFSSIFFLGLRETAKIMSDPFGSDAFDFPVTSFGVQTLNECRLLMAQRDPDELSPEADGALFEQ